MPEVFKPGCQRPTIKKAAPAAAETIEVSEKEVNSMLPKVGKAAPDLPLPGSIKGSL